MFGGLISANGMRASMGLKRLCNACSKPIMIQIFQGTDWCSDDCRKIIQKEV